MLTKVERGDFNTKGQIVNLFNDLVIDFHYLGTPYKVDRFKSKKEGCREVNRLIEKLNIKLEKRAKKIAKKLEKEKVKAKKKDKLIDSKKVKKIKIKKCITEKKNGKFSPVKTANKIFDKFYEKKELTRKEFILLCSKAKINKNTAAGAWTKKAKEYKNKLEVK